MCIEKTIYISRLPLGLEFIQLRAAWPKTYKADVVQELGFLSLVSGVKLWKVRRLYAKSTEQS